MAMDIQRPDLLKKKRKKQIIYSVTVAVVLIVGLGFTFMLEPAVPRIDSKAVWIGEVSRGTMLRQVRGMGALVPEEIRWITSRTSGRVERLIELPGVWVDPETIILELSNPELLQEANNAELQLKGTEADFISYKVQLENELLKMKSELAQLEAQYKEAQLEAEVNDELYAEGLIAKLTQKKSILRAEQLATRWEIEKQRVVARDESLESQLATRRAKIEQDRAIYELFNSQVDGLIVKAAVSGVLQRLSVEEGMQVNAGENLFQVANPKKLKAVIRIPEIQAKDVQIGQVAEIDTRNGFVDGLVTRVDPNVENNTVAVDVQLKGELPKGARPDLTVEGRIELENLEDVIYVGRPVFGRSDTPVGIFKFLPDSEIAERTRVQFGRASVSTIEVVDGLVPGDKIILSDTTAWDKYDRIQVH